MRKERDITIKIIQVERINNKRLAEFFASKYMEDKKYISEEKS